MKKENPTQVAIVEDIKDILEYLRDLVNEHPQFECQHLYVNAEEAIAFLPHSGVGIVVVDIGFKGKGTLNGIDCVREVKPQMPNTLFMMYTVFENADKIFESLKAGANGYLLKDATDEQIIAALEDLLKGGAPMSGAIARKVIEFFQKPSAPCKEIEDLTEREREILQLLSRGFSYKGIADEIGIKEGTVKVHIHNVYEKLHVTNSRQAIEKLHGNE
jgi:DNA-binding NarL/FixJ family response regulator